MLIHISVRREPVYVLVRTASTQRGGSNEYPQSMFSSKIKKNNVYPCKPQFYYIKVGFKGVKIIEASFRDGNEQPQGHTRNKQHQNHRHRTTSTSPKKIP